MSERPSDAIASFQSLHPCKVDLGLFHAAPQARVADFFDANGDALVDVSDQGGHVVDSRPLHHLHAWWDTTAPVSNSPGHVVHWPLASSRDLARPPFHAFADVTSFLSGIDAALISLFDQYRYARTPDYSWVILGPAGTVVRPHRDMFHTASWNLLYAGQKTWEFWRPTPAHTDGIAADIEMVQQPGELIWIPEGWWHRVRYHGPAICLSRNLLLRRSLDQVRAELKVRDAHLSHIVDAMLLVEQRKSNDANTVDDR